jgi:membrane protease YdiL (CAAX protease family)
LIVGAVITFVLVRFTHADASHPIIKQLGGGPVLWMWIFLLAAAWAPVTEELMFRGALFAHLRERFGWWISAPVVGLVFALIHPQGWAAVPVLTAIAVVFAGIREWRGSIIGCVAAHAIHNGAALIIATLILT